MERQRNSAKTILKKTERSRLTLLFQAFLDGHQQCQAWVEGRHAGGGSNREPGRALRERSQLILNESAKAIQRRQDRLFSKQHWSN